MVGLCQKIYHMMKLKIDNNIKVEEVLQTSDDNDVGYIVELDFEFPPEIHDKLKEYPPAPEILTPKDEWMSDYQLELRKKNGIKSKSPKLIPHLMKHEKYCIHYRNLKLLYNLGGKISKIHRVVSYNQSNWLEPYINFNTDTRKREKKKKGQRQNSKRIFLN